MVAHLSSKLSHLAQSFRPQTLRGAFPGSSTPHPNQFFTASTPSAAGPGPNSGLNTPGPFTSNGAPSGRKDGEAAGGGRRSAGAGAGQRNWGFQPHVRLTAQAPASADASLLDDDSPAPSTRPRPRYVLSRDSSRRLLLPTRRTSLTASGPELLAVDEAPRGARLSSVEMQRRYRSAFSRGQRTEELREMERDEEQLDAVLGKSESNVVSSGRRASISSNSSALVSAAPTPRAASPARQLHTSSFPACEPPKADVARVRRNSTSAVEGPTVSTETSSPPLADGDALKAPKRAMAPIQRRTRTSSPADGGLRTPVAAPAGVSAEAQQWFVDITSARASKSYKKVLATVEAYRRQPKLWTTGAHNAAIDALATTRLPNAPITHLVELYNDLFSVEGLKPTRRSYELVIDVFCRRDDEVLSAIRLLENRVKKRKLAARARGPWNADIAGNERRMTEDELDTLAQLRKDDYLSPAVEIYKALGQTADRLDSFAINALINGAANRGRIDLALSLFSRLENSLFQSLTAGTYVALIDMYGQAKDAEAVSQVFEAYLAARKAGLRGPASNSKRVYSKKVPVKSRHSPEAEFQQDVANSATKGDEWIWRSAIKALFDCARPVEAVALLERMLQAQVAGGEVQPGYAAGLHAVTIAVVVRGFCQAGDIESAVTWFDRVHAGQESDKTLPHFYSTALYGGIESGQNPLFINHVYRAWLDQAGADHLISISDFMVVVDFNLAQAFATSDPALKTAHLDAIAEFRPRFEAAVRAGFVEGVDVHFNLSSGMFQRLAAGYGLAGRYAESAEAISSLGNIIRGILAQGTDERAFRTPKTWVIKISDSAAAALGMVPGPKSLHFEQAVPAQGIPRPHVKDAATIVGWVNRLRSAIDLRPVPRYADVVVVAYLTAKADAEGDIKALLLNGHEWFTIIEAFATTAASIHAGFKPDFAYPGFESIIDDFLQSEQLISADRGYDFVGLLDALARAGMPPQRRMAVLSAVNPKLARQYQDNQSLEQQQRKPREEQDNAAAVTAEPATQATTPLVELIESQFATPESLPTPPSTPPPYFAELSPVPARTAPNGQIENALTSRVEALMHSNKLAPAFELILEQANGGKFAHPESLSKLIEIFGRNGALDKVRALYLIAYDAIARLGDEQSQSLAWINLEDRMIIALAQLGELQDVAVHRDRLYDAGSAPSADAYAAMILNMKETTDDAAVAVTIFEESQRCNVAPNVYLFNTLISKLSRARRAKDALVYFELMKQCQLQPSSITYGAIIAACCKAGDGAAAEYLFAEMSSSPGFRPRVPPYNTMMQYFTHTKPDRERALAYFDAMLQKGVQPTGHTYKLLLDAYGAVGEPDLASMEDIFARLVTDRHVSVTGAHWASLIHAHGGVKGDLDSALGVFDSIKSHPSSKRSLAQGQPALPDAVVYEALLNACVANSRPDLCERYLEQMRSEGVRMTAYVANTLIKAHAARGDLNSARAVFEGMADPPSGVAAAGNHERGRAAGVDAPVYREPSTWDIMIRAYVAQGEVAEASGLLQRMEQRAFPEAVYNKVRKALAEVGAERLDVQ